MRKIHNAKNSGFTYATTDILSAINTQAKHTPVLHVDMGKGIHYPNAEMVDWAKSLDPLAVPVFHRFHRQVECPSALGLSLSPLAS